MGRGEIWTEAEKAYARQLRVRRLRRKLIAQELGKSEGAIKGFFERDRPARSPVLNNRVVAPLSVFEERDRRANEPRASGGMMGEPPLSQSALAMSLRIGESLKSNASISGFQTAQPQSES